VMIGLAHIGGDSVYSPLGLGFDWSEYLKLHSRQACAALSGEFVPPFEAGTM
jgi:hypothetical protein